MPSELPKPGLQQAGGKKVLARTGLAILIGEGTTVTYRAHGDTLVFFVLNPRDWDRRS